VSDWIDRIVPLLLAWVPAVVTIGLSVTLLTLFNGWFRRQNRMAGDARRVVQQLTMLGLTAIAVVAVVMALPLESDQRGQLLSLLGLLLSAAIALASTTFLGNAIAGLMIRAVEDFAPGDFIQVGEFFGRVSERGLLHVEIQTEARDLVTIPNLHIVSNPVQVVHADGTVVSADVSLGYDLDRMRVEAALLQAAEAAGLRDPFVRVLALGDFSVSYRASGFLEDVKQILSARSRLHGAVLDALHGDGMEIVSPTFMNQRALDPAARILADPARRAPKHDNESEAAVEDLVFDKAESAALREQLRRQKERIVELRERLQEQLAAEANDEEKARLEGQIERVGRQIERLDLALSEEAE
jgi:small-conductance mechanosensitive channel